MNQAKGILIKGQLLGREIMNIEQNREEKAGLLRPIVSSRQVSPLSLESDQGVKLY